MSYWLLLYLALLGSGSSTTPHPDIPPPVCQSGRPC